MPDLRSLAHELKRRRVFRTAAAYAAGAFIALQVAEVTFEPLHLPGWVMTALVVGAFAGFPVTIVLAWIFDITAEGVRRTRAGPPDASPAADSRGWDAVTFAALGVGLLLAGVIGVGVTTRYLPEADGATAAIPAVEASARSIAVLPFTNLSDQPETDYFSDGITEDILTALASFEDLRVVSRTSVMGYKGTTRNVREVAAELGVGTVLEGSVRRAGSRVRITAQFIDATTDEHLWAETYDRELDDIFTVQSEIAEQIAGALHATLSAADQERLARSPTDNVIAYELFLRGRQQLAGFGIRNAEDAVALLRQAVALDSAYALAYAAIGQAYMRRAAVTGEGLWRDSAMAAAQRALEIDPTAAEPHEVLGSILLETGLPDAALEAFGTAVDLKPNHAPAIAGIAGVHWSAGRYDEALRWYRRAMKVEPNSARHHLSLASNYASLGDFDAARQWLARALDLEPDLWAAHRLLAYVHMRAGDDGKAVHQTDPLLENLRGEPRFQELVTALRLDVRRMRERVEAGLASLPAELRGSVS